MIHVSFFFRIKFLLIITPSVSVLMFCVQDLLDFIVFLSSVGFDVFSFVEGICLIQFNESNQNQIV